MSTDPISTTPQGLGNPPGNDLSDNPELRLAWDIIENTGVSLFLTGKAGTGKTTFLRRLKEQSMKRLAVVAPTGIAAINAGGSTIHSFFQLDFAPFLPGQKTNRKKFSMTRQKMQTIRALDLLVIDEISMVRADVLDAVNDVLRRLRDRSRPFGGVQLLLIGDLQQLPPVLRETEAEMLQPYYPTPYFFDSTALRGMPLQVVELTHVYRQSDQEFISILNAIRSGYADTETLRRLNTRYIPGFVPPEGTRYVRLTTHNELARKVNEAELERLKTKTVKFTARVDGQFPETSFPADFTLELKKGAQVMFVKNDLSGERRYYNGMLGTVEEIAEGKVTVRIADSGLSITVGSETWDNNRYEIDPESLEMKTVREGSFSQVPLRLAWAITIHKSQGLTFSHAIIDASRSFAHGQTYVALSRCRTLEGLVLEQPLGHSAIITDSRVAAFIAAGLANAAGPEQVEELKTDYRLQCLDGMFDFSPILNAQEEYYRIMVEAYSRLYPRVVEMHGNYARERRAPLRDIAERFARQYRGIMARPDSGNLLDARLSAGAEYFLKELAAIDTMLAETPATHDSKEMEKRLMQAREELEKLVTVRRAELKSVVKLGFSVETYLKARAEGGVKATRAPHTSRKGSGGAGTATVAKEVANRDLYRRLLDWRAELMHELNVPGYQICSNKTLLRVAATLPTDSRQLLAVPGVGKMTAGRYGEAWLEMVDDYLRLSARPGETTDETRRRLVVDIR